MHRMGQPKMWVQPICLSFVPKERGMIIGTEKRIGQQKEKVNIFFRYFSAGTLRGF